MASETSMLLPVAVVILLVISTPCTNSAGTDGDHVGTVGYHVDDHVTHNDEGSHPHGNNMTPEEHTEEHHPHSVHLAKWNFDYVAWPLLITVYALFIGLAKVGFHHASFLSSWLPESSLLILIGGLTGGISFALGHPFGQYKFEAQTFFLFLLPPIILESAFSLHDRNFANNLGSILVYAVIGTLLNTFIVGPLLYGFAFTGLYGDDFTITLTQCLVFSALISAVDPVAVLAIFEEVHVNNVLYFLVFGESLLNDAITVVLYNMMNSFATMSTIPVTQILLGVGSFFTVSLGAVVVGLLVGVLTAVITKYMGKIRVVEPLALIGMAYLSYLLAELFHFSGIISIIICGLTQKEYAFGNVSRKSYTTVKYFTKMLATVTEGIIFLQLGDIFWSVDHELNMGFVLITLVLISFCRGLITTCLTGLLNQHRAVNINVQEQFIMCYGGLRGAVAFALVVLLDDTFIPMRNMMITTTLVVVIFTVFVQGGTIKPLVKLMHIRLSVEKEETVSSTIHANVVDFMMAGIEEISGQKGDNYFRVLMEYYDEKYLKHWLQKRPTTLATEVMATFEKVTFKDHHEHIFDVSNAPIADKDALLPPRHLIGGVNTGTRMLSSLPDRFYLEQPADSAPGSTASTPKKSPATNISELKLILKKNPGTQLHRTFDKNLKHDDKNDLAEQMHHRNRRHSLVRQHHHRRRFGSPATSSNFSSRPASLISSAYTDDASSVTHGHVPVIHLDPVQDEREAGRANNGDDSRLLPVGRNHHNHLLPPLREESVGANRGEVNSVYENMEEDYV